jgi:SAM-dependent methyltransferase
MSGAVPGEDRFLTGLMGHAEAAKVEFLRQVLPAELQPVFDVSFIRSHHLYTEFVCRLSLQIVRESGIEAALAEGGSPPEIAGRAGLEHRQALVPLDWMLRFLSARGLIEAIPGDPVGRYRLRDPLPSLDPAPVRQEQLSHDRSWIPAYELAETVARDYPAFLRGEVAGEQVLFAPRRLRLWIDYFSNDHGLYAVNNQVGAVAAERWLRGSREVVLELGGGLGSGALALLDRLESAGRLVAIAGYRFTELVPAFLRRGEQTLRNRYPTFSGFAFQLLDINRPFADQGVEPGGVSVVYAVNTLHAAHDLGFTLDQVLQTLAPGGLLVVSECVRPRQPIYAEFGFHLTQAFQSPRLHSIYRPSGGFLTAEHWKAALEAAGFLDVRVMPDVTRIHDAIPDFAVAAIGATRPRRRQTGIREE